MPIRVFSRPVVLLMDNHNSPDGMLLASTICGNASNRHFIPFPEGPVNQYMCGGSRADWPFIPMTAAAINRTDFNAMFYYNTLMQMVYDHDRPLPLCFPKNMG